jgi:diguanylate cyclase (GGDEF)-like protein
MSTGKLLDRELAAENERRRVVKEKLAPSSDVLTGLFDRQAWDEFAGDEVRIADARGVCHHMLSIDLDGLKAINDRYGRDAGDQAIRVAADMIREAVRDTDFLARFGGDRFAALLLDSPSETAMVIKTRIHKKLGGRGISASIGVESTRGHETLRQAWASADEKMYGEKKTRRPF